jgi:DNA-binding transcriptional LysR family regulator
MTLQQFEVFVKVVETKSFTKAGEILALTQSAISHIISSLEIELGFNLLHRNRAGVTITNEGQKIFQHALDLLNKSELIKQEAASILGIQSGVLKIGCFPSFSAKILPDIILRYNEKYPKIELKIFEGNYNEIEKWVSTGIIDLGFSAIPPETLDFIPLLQDDLVVIVNDHHLFSLREEISISEIESQSYIMSKSGCDVLLKQIFKENNVHPNITFKIEDNNTLLAMVSKGFGISIVPKMILNFKPLQLNVIKLSPRQFRTVGILLKSMKTASPASLCFIKGIKYYSSIT